VAIKYEGRGGLEGRNK